MTQEDRGSDPRERLLDSHGTPGTGKTALLEALRRTGVTCYGEPARAVLRSQLAVDGPALPAKDPLLFVQAMLEHSRSDFLAARSATGPVFFDRGIPDLVAYAIRFGVNPTEFEQAAAMLRYNGTVFVLPPWKDIFVNDSERRLTYEASLAFHVLLVSSYTRLAYDLLETPRTTIDARVELLVRHTCGRGGCLSLPG